MLLHINTALLLKVKSRVMRFFFFLSIKLGAVKSVLNNKTHDLGYMSQFSFKYAL